MAQIHISKDPPDKTPLVPYCTALVRYIVLGRFGLNGNYIRQILLQSAPLRA